MRESGVLNFILFLSKQRDAATLTLLQCNAILFDAPYKSLAWAFSFYLAKVVSRKQDFIVIEGVEWWRILFFYSSFHHELFDTDQVSLMIQLSGSKTKSLSTRHG